MSRDAFSTTLQQSLLQAQAGQTGKEWWRSLEEFADSSALQEWATEEFPNFADLLNTATDRRQLLKLMGASLALAALSGCSTRDDARIVPYVEQPENLVPGVARYFATTLEQQGYGIGVLAESHTGRPTKIEGNPRHPASLGAATPAMQASVLELYDPQRSRIPLFRGDVANWSRFEAAMVELRDDLMRNKGAGVALLLPTVTSPTLRAQLTRLQKQWPQLRWFKHDPINHDNVIDGARKAFGKPLLPLATFDKTERVLSLDADFLTSGPAQLAAARSFMAKRRVDGQPTANATMNRLYVVEPTLSNTGAVADHRWPLAGRDIEQFASQLLQQITGGDKQQAGSDARINALAKDLQAHAGRSLVIAGQAQPAAVHQLTHALNFALQNFGATVDLIEAPENTEGEALTDLVEALRQDEIKTLFMLNVNPVYSAPADLEFREAVMKVPLRVHLGLYADETAAVSHWHLPLAHDLESWGDLRAFDGTASLQQPLIAPLYNGQTMTEILGLLDRQRLQQALPNDAWHLTRETWQQHFKGEDFEQFWRLSLNDGVIANTRHAALKLPTSPPALSQVQRESTDAIELLFRPDPTIGDGRHSANAWLQELPKPLTRLTWENVALVSPKLAQDLNVSNGQIIAIDHGEQTLETPVWIMPGQARHSITLFLGYGRTQTGPLGVGIGYNAYRLRSAANPWQSHGAQITARSGHAELASTQHHHAMHGHNVLRSGSVQDYRKQPAIIAADGAPPPGEHESLNAEPGPGADPGNEQDYHWGMTIDLNACIGCESCVAACQAENNIPVVGKEEVSRGRAMHWIRVDRYFAGSPQDPQTAFQPVPCMHCENAPCEYVCPVGATQHSPEGLNEMVYNRCIGTRYCSQNCPYKVRRFNWFDYTNNEDSPLVSPAAVHNPDVSVRVRGVMEKCTYCVQRITEKRIDAQKEGRLIRDGELVTACQQSCPTEAIAFGNLRDPDSTVSRLKKTPRNYALLAETNTRPRTSYLTELKNPNLELPSLAEHEGSDDG